MSGLDLESFYSLLAGCYWNVISFLRGILMLVLVLLASAINIVYMIATHIHTLTSCKKREKREFIYLLITYRFVSCLFVRHSTQLDTHNSHHHHHHCNHQHRSRN